MIRTNLFTKVGVKKIFVATFASYGSAVTDEGECATALLLDVKDHGTIIASHVWVKLTPEFNQLKEGEKIMFTAEVKPYPKKHHNIKWDVGLTNLTKVKRCAYQ